MSPKSPLGEAISYAWLNWTALTRYNEQGYLSIDKLPKATHCFARALRNVGVCRKN